MLKKIETLCQSHDINLTAPRLAVLELLSENKEAKTAYELLDQYRKKNPSGQAMTIYRSLDYLVKKQVVHKISSQNSYQLCTESHTESMSFILACTVCHQSIEVPFKSKIILKILRENIFEMSAPVIEITGTCKHCSIQKL